MQGLVAASPHVDRLQARPPPRLLNWLYEITSGYGHSIARPLTLLGQSFALGWAVFSGWPTFHGKPLSDADALALSFHNIFSFLPQRREFMTPDFYAGLSTSAHIIGGVQTVLALVLFFLLGLALRNKFRMR
jgi:hypothetical protein